MDELLPSDLCKICHTNPHKYCCPRCSTRTCSLACSRRHKQWAQCNGVRDPAVYVKRSDLATPRAIDHDYNFLTSIERTIDRAERDVTGRGVVLQHGHTQGWRWKGLHGPVKGEVRVKAALNECGVMVRNAPAGMTRAKQNNTGWSQKKRTLVWTIEWIHNNGRSELGSCLASCALEDAYASQISPRPAKRKRDSSSPSPSSSAPPNPVLPPSPRPSRPDPRPSPSPAKAPLYFYLLRPGTPTGTRVLIPLEPTATLSTALRHRVVLEFPTLYALRYPPANLPTAFITEALYDRQGQRSEALLGTAEAGREAWDGGTGGGESATAEAGNGDVDERKLAEVLARDLGA